MFAELLKHELSPHADESRRLHRRASAWYRAHGFASGAIRQATAAGDVDDASRLIIDHWIEARDSARSRLTTCGVAACRAINQYFAGDAEGVMAAAGPLLSLRRAIDLAEVTGHQLALVHALGWFVVVHAERRQPADVRLALDKIDASSTSFPDSRPTTARPWPTSRVRLPLAPRPRRPLVEPELRRGIDLARRGRARWKKPSA